MRRNKNKLKNLIVYILSEYNNSNLTETKLQKLLYFCDFECYEISGKSITGFKYKKNHYGPTIIDLGDYLKELKEEGYIEIIEGETSYGSPKKTFALKKSIGDFRKVFSDLELKTIDDVNNAYVGLKPTEISKLSHSDFPYLATNDRKYIDYNLVKYRDTEEANQSKEDYSVFSSGEFYNIVGKFAKTLQDSGN